MASMMIPFLVVGLFGFMIGMVLLIIGFFKKVNMHGGWTAGVSALLLLVGVGILSSELQKLDKSKMDDPLPATAPSTLKEQFEEAELALQQSEKSATVLDLLNPSEVSLAVQADAEAKWPDNPNLQKSEVERQMTALEELQAVDLDSQPHKTLLENAIEEEAPVLRAIQYEYDAQLKDYERVNAPDLSPLEKRFMENAKTEYGDNYTLVLYHAGRQLEAYNWVESQNLNTEARRQTMAAAKTEYGEDFTLIRFVYEEQFPETKN